MPLSLDDLRKTTSAGRRGQPRRISPTLIDTAPERELAADFCRYFAELSEANRRQRDFSEQYLTERAGGDFKLARGLISAMLGFYGWDSESFQERLTPAQYEQLQSLGLTNSSVLRLALYSYISTAPRAGFVGKAGRAEALELFAAGVGLEPALVEEMLFLDNEENALLRLRKRQDGQSFRPPTAQEVIRRYNRMAIETLLYNSSEVIFGFGTLLPGALVKRIGYFSKELHIPYDLDYNSAGEIQLRLYGPVQAFGSPTRHGDRLARLTFLTLALANRSPGGDTGLAENFSVPVNTVLVASQAKGTAKKPTAVSPVLSALAQVHLRDKVYFFDVASVAEYLARPDEKIEEVVLTPSAEDTDNAEIHESGEVYTVARQFDRVAYYKQKETARRDFDSSIEARFHAEFSALAREGHTAGWQIEREPEAIALPAQHLLFVPDFALQRGSTRVWLEIIGFWTADYRQRKLEKLEKLKAHGEYKLLLAVDTSLQADFQEGPPGQKRPAPFPTIFYKNELRATDVIALLGREYDDQAGRLQQVTQAGQNLFNDQLAVRGFLPEDELYRLLKAYNKNELMIALEKLSPAGSYIDGYGLCSSIYLQAAGAALEDALKDGLRLSFEQICQALAAAGLEYNSGRLEALLMALPVVTIVRPSLFEVYVQAANLPVELPELAVVGKTRKSRR